MKFKEQNMKIFEKIKIWNNYYEIYTVTYSESFILWFMCKFKFKIIKHF